MKSFFSLLFKIILLTISVDAGEITNQVVKTKYGHTCVLPTVVDEPTNYLFLGNPQKGEVLRYCTREYTSILRHWAWCSYGKKFPEVVNGTKHFKTDYCTDYSWEFEGYKYKWDEATHPKSSYKDAVEFCESLGGELPYFEAEKYSTEQFQYLTYGLFDIQWKHEEKTPVYEGDEKLRVFKALRPLFAKHESDCSSCAVKRKGFWMRTEQIVGRYQEIVPEGYRREEPLIEGEYYPDRSLTVTPRGTAKMVDSRTDTDVLCRFPIEKEKSA